MRTPPCLSEPCSAGVMHIDNRARIQRREELLHLSADREYRFGAKELDLASQVPAKALVDGKRMQMIKTLCALALDKLRDGNPPKDAVIVMETEEVIEVAHELARESRTARLDQLLRQWQLCAHKRDAREIAVSFALLVKRQPSGIHADDKDV